MDNVWLWVTPALAGALHGLNPATGWAIVAWMQRRGERGRMLRAISAMALGHGAALVLAAASVPLALRLGWRLRLDVLGACAAVLLALLVAHHLVSHVQGRAPSRRPTSHVALGLWSFIMAGAHGAGLALIPVFAMVCGDPAAQSAQSAAPLLLAAAALAVHMAAMLATTAVLAVIACKALPDWPWAAA